MYEEKPVFQVMFLENDTENVFVEEVDEINFSKIKEHLEHGESIFISTRRRELSNISQTRNKVNEKDGLITTDKRKKARARERVVVHFRDA